MKADCRPFRLSDAMILIAAVGVGTAWLVSVIHTHDERGYIPESFDASTPMNLLRSLAYGVRGYLPPILAWLSVGITVIRLRRPRPGVRRIGRRPGAVACLVALASWWLGAIWSTITGICQRIEADRLGDWAASVWFELTDYPTPAAGLCVAASWSALWLAGAWRPCPCWIDRIGRAVGSAWVAYFAADTFIMGLPFML
jgi:hypothetical protein